MSAEVYLFSGFGLALISLVPYVLKRVLSANIAVALGMLFTITGTLMLYFKLHQFYALLIGLVLVAGYMILLYLFFKVIESKKGA